ncbi:MAG: DUF6691 family protein [Saccharospirillum sp.]|jgi:uncharacterized membrane protein YedE/YeeE
MRSLISLLTGVLFGVGLCISEMVNPIRVIGFLDIAGTWDPSLAFVLAGGLTVMIVANLISRFMSRPLYAEYWRLPSLKRIDTPLIVGSAVFGIGWGVGGFCPGPAITAIAYSDASMLLGVVMYFVGALLVVSYRHLRSPPGQARVA